jgi:hypothetical protein
MVYITLELLGYPLHPILVPPATSLAEVMNGLSVEGSGKRRLDDELKTYLK